MVQPPFLNNGRNHIHKYTEPISSFQEVVGCAKPTLVQESLELVLGKGNITVGGIGGDSDWNGLAASATVVVEEEYI